MSLMVEASVQQVSEVQGSLLRVVTAGSVDDGKSTLVGRLLFDAKAVLSDTLEAVTRASVGSTPDLSLLVDGLRAEREQGITIDVAWRYLTTARRSIVLADCPGHVQYTRNTVTGASTADVALLLVDARTGVVEQTRRHAAVMALLRVRHVVLVVNKVDLVDFSEEVVARIGADFVATATSLGIEDVRVVPVSALLGDNVTEPSAGMPWYAGPTLLDLLETLEVPPPADVALRFPVQGVVRRDGTRYYLGTVGSGVLRPGDEVVVQPSGVRAMVHSISTPDGLLDAAGTGAAVAVRLDRDVDVSRGDTFCAGDAPAVGRVLELEVAILGARSLQVGDRVRCRHTGRLVRGVVTGIDGALDLATGAHAPATSLVTNDLGLITMTVAEPLVLDPYDHNRTTGAVLLQDEATGDVLAAGLVRRAQA